MAFALTTDRPLDGAGRRAKAALEMLSSSARAQPRLAVSAALAVLAAVVAIVFQVLTLSPAASQPPPAPPPMIVQPIDPVKAQAINAALPLAHTSNPAADPFPAAKSAASRAEALQCLTEAVYYEAGNQSIDGARAVAQVVLNRVRHPAFPSSVCGVVYQGSTRITGCQFTFTCDGSLYSQPNVAGWKRAKAVAEAALKGSVYAPVGWATHYHANYVVPVWAASLAKNAVVGAHLFYHWAGGWGQPRAFDQAYSGREGSAKALRSAALAAEAATVAVTGEDDAATLEDVASLPGVEELKITPSMRGDKRVAVRFNQVARKAAEEAPRREYVQRVEASDNLKFALSGEAASTSEAPLGSKPQE